MKKNRLQKKKSYEEKRYVKNWSSLSGKKHFFRKKRKKIDWSFFVFGTKAIPDDFCTRKNYWRNFILNLDLFIYFKFLI